MDHDVCTLPIPSEFRYSVYAYNIGTYGRYKITTLRVLIQNSTYLIVYMRYLSIMMLHIIVVQYYCLHAQLRAHVINPLAGCATFYHTRTDSRPAPFHPQTLTARPLVPPPPWTPCPNTTHTVTNDGRTTPHTQPHCIHPIDPFAHRHLHTLSYKHGCTLRPKISLSRTQSYSVQCPPLPATPHTLINTCIDNVTILFHRNTTVAQHIDSRAYTNNCQNPSMVSLPW
jgi:hypothetical protein